MRNHAIACDRGPAARRRGARRRSRPSTRAGRRWSRQRICHPASPDLIPGAKGKDDDHEEDAHSHSGNRIRHDRQRIPLARVGQFLCRLFQFGRAKIVRRGIDEVADQADGVDHALHPRLAAVNPDPGVDMKILAGRRRVPVHDAWTDGPHEPWPGPGADRRRPRRLIPYGVPATGRSASPAGTATTPRRLWR